MNSNKLGVNCSFTLDFSVLNYNSYRHHHHKKLLMTTTQTQKGGDQNAITTFIRLFNAAEKSVFVLRQDGVEVAIVSNSEVNNQ